VKAETAAGSVTADFALVACNAYLGDLLPKVRTTIMPVATYMTATEVLGANRAQALIPGDIAVGDANFVLNYFRRSSDHRLLFGGGVSYTAAMPPRLPAQMRRMMLRIFPQLAGAKQDFTWGGNVAITQDRTPDFGRVGSNILYAQGFSGQGVALTAIAGKTMAEAVAGQAERFDLFAKLPHRRFPGGKLLRTPTLALAMTWFRLKDWL
jgi:gamma-glutamylputrescine oxidase